MTTMGYAVKRQLVAAFRGLAAEGGQLDALGLDGVHYRWPGPRGLRRHIYFGGVRGLPVDDATAGQNDTLVKEAATVTFYIRIVVATGESDADTAQEEADGIAEAVGDAIGAWLGVHRDFAGPGTHAAFAFASGDYSENDTDVVSVLAYAVTVTGYLRLTPTPQEV